MRIKYNKFVSPLNFRRGSFSLIYLISLIALSFGQLQASDEVIRVGVYQDPPLVFITERGVVKGLFIDILEHIAEKEDWDLRYVAGTFSQCFERLEKKQIDLLVDIPFSKKWNQQFDFTEDAIISTWGQIYTNDYDIQSIVDLKNKKLAVREKDIFYQGLSPIIDQLNIDLELIRLNHYEEIFEYIEDGKADAGIVSQFFGQKNEKDYQVVRSPIVCSPGDIRFAALKGKGKNSNILVFIGIHLKALKRDKNSIYYQAMSKWFGEVPDNWLSGWVIWIFVAILELAVMFIFGVLVYRKFVDNAIQRTDLKWQDKDSERVAQIEELKKSELKYHAIFENALDGIARVGAKNQIVIANYTLATILGYESAEEIKSQVADIFKELFVDPSYAASFIRKVEKMDRTYGFEAQFIRKDRLKMWVSLDARAIKNLDGRIDFIELFVKDISPRKRAEDALKNQKERLEVLNQQRTVELIKTNNKLTSAVKELEWRTNEILILNQFADLLQVCDTEEETHEIVIKICRQLFPSDSGYICLFDRDQEILKIVDYWGDAAPSLLEFEQNQCWAIRRGKVHFMYNSDVDALCEHVPQMPNFGCICAPMFAQGEVLGLIHLVMGPVFSTQSEEKREQLFEYKKEQLTGVVERYVPCLTNLRLRATLRIQSIRDPLTGLYNRRYMQEFLERETLRNKRRGASLGIVMMDVDHFKLFNDNFGHEAGDTVLTELGAFLQKFTRGEDIACRYGGEEFLLLMPEISMEDIEKKAGRLRSDIKHVLRIRHQGEVHKITVSIGVAIFPNHGDTADAVLNAADAALYKAKANGRDQVVLASNELPLD